MDLVLWLNSFIINMNQPAPYTSPSYPGTQTLVSQGSPSGPAVSHGDFPEDTLPGHPGGNTQPCKPGKGQDKYDVYGNTRLPTSSLQALLVQSVPVSHSVPSHPLAMPRGAHILGLEALLKRSRCEGSRGRSFKP